MPILPIISVSEGATRMGKVENLIKAIDNLKRKLDIPMSIKAAMPDSFDDQCFLNEVDDMAVQAFDDQCTGANPRYPLINDLKEI